MNAERELRKEGDEVQTGTDTGVPVRKTTSELRTVRACDLLGGDRILRIEHEGQLYTLRITRNERLILTK